jgi:hypothetical protein
LISRIGSGVISDAPFQAAGPLMEVPLTHNARAAEFVTPLMNKRRRLKAACIMPTSYFPVNDSPAKCRPFGVLDTTRADGS